MNRTIYLVLFTLAVGGAERHASSIANYLLQRGYNVKIVLLQDNVVDYTLADEIEVVALSDLQCPDNVKNPKINIWDKLRLKIYSVLSEEKYKYLDRKLWLELHYINKLRFYFSEQDNVENSLVISFMTMPNITMSMLKNFFGYKLILSEFTSPHLEFAAEAPENKLKRKFYSNADGFIFQTDEQKEYYSYLSQVKMQVIPNPIEDIETLPYHGTRKKEIVNYCRHVKAKNLPLLIESFAKLVKEYPEYKLVIYGDGPERQNVEKSIIEYGIIDKVLLKPFAKNVLELVRESTMFVSSSDREGISNSMLEAMAIGLPTVCTDCPAGGARMFIEPYRNGLIVPVRDSEALYKAMKYVIDNPKEAESMSRNAVSVRKDLEKKKILNQWLDFLNMI